MRCKDKVAVVTGGGGGIGKAIAAALAEEGARVVIWDVGEEAMDRAVEEIEARGGTASRMRVDVSSGSQVRQAARLVLEKWGRVDILVNNAGICKVTPLAEITEEDWDRVLAVNLKGTFLCSQAFLETMKLRRGGKVINLGSVSGKVGGIVAGAHYSASKAAVMCFTKSLARELAPYGVNVNGLAPGVIATDMSRMISGGDYAEYLRAIPLGRIGTVEETARVAVFLASDGASYLTGEIIDVNGGQFMD